MLILLLALLGGIAIWGIAPRRAEDPDGMSLAQTTSIKGLFSLVILLSHLKQYVALDSVGDSLYGAVLGYVGQLMVAPFLFCSGYGILYGLDRKKDYEKGFFLARGVRTWVRFAVAVALYALMNLCLGISYAPQTVVLAFTGWDTIGNSNWFVFDILVLYLGVQVSIRVLSRFAGRLEKQRKLFVFAGLIALWTVGLIAALFLCKQSWWYDTLLCFPAGAAFYLLKPRLDVWWKDAKRYWRIGTGLMAAFVLLYLAGGLLYNLCAVCFCLLIVWFTARVKLGNRVLSWTGIHSFYIYIYMRVPMIILERLTWNRYPLAYGAGCIALTMLLAFAMKKVTDLLEKKLFAGK